MRDRFILVHAHLLFVNWMLLLRILDQISFCVKADLEGCIKVDLRAVNWFFVTFTCFKEQILIEMLPSHNWMHLLSCIDSFEILFGEGRLLSFSIYIVIKFQTFSLSIRIGELKITFLSHSIIMEQSHVFCWSNWFMWFFVFRVPLSVFTLYRSPLTHLWIFSYRRTHSWNATFTNASWSLIAKTRTLRVFSCRL